jgi:hypothetical protein
MSGAQPKTVEKYDFPKGLMRNKLAYEGEHF